MNYREFPAPPPLADTVHCIWCLSGRAEPGAVQTIVPDGRSELILHYADPFAEVDAAGRARRQGSGLIAGQLTGPFVVMPSTTFDVVGIRLRTGAARAVLGIAMDELTDRVTSMDAVTPRLFQDLWAAGERPAPPPQRATAVAAALVRHATRRQVPPIIREAVHRLDVPNGPTVRGLARTLSVTPRSLERRFKHEVGVPPQLMGRILRFRRLFGLLQQQAGAAAATTAGYYDQAHAIRDFREFAGASPSAFFKDAPDLARALLGDGVVEAI